MIVFVYDTSYCQTEEDDPQKAVLFFYPQWVSDQQRLALCGQLMGAAHFCSSVFSTPRVLSLQSGKFVLKRFDQFILSVGSDQTLPDWVLNERFNILQSLLEFYHKSFNAILASVNSEYQLFTKKLYEVFDVYNPIIQYIATTFGNIPTLKFPRKKSTMFLEAYQLLESCCTFEGVLGGTILHNSKVIASVLDSDVTKLLALTDPCRMRTGAEQIKTPFHLPLGVQLMKVYLKHSTYESAGDNRTAKSPFDTGTSKKQENVAHDLDMKQDFTKMFTVPEEEENNISSLFKEAKGLNVRELNRQKKRKLSKAKIDNTLKERSKNFVANFNIKVCSTPTVEKTIVHEDFVSICNNPKLEAKPASLHSLGFAPDLPSSLIKSNQSGQLVEAKYTNKNLYRISMDDLMIDFSYKNYPVPLRYYSFGLPKICKEVEQTIKDEQKKRKLYKTRFYKTIADPSNPVFRFDGFPISKSLYNHCLDEHHKDFITANITIDSREELIKRKNLELEVFKLKKEKVTTLGMNANQTTNHPKNSTSGKDDSDAEQNVQVNSSVPKEKYLTRANQKLFRRSLTLPLKPTLFHGTDESDHMSAVKNKVLHAITPTTPLMTKLSLLALEEESDGKCYPGTVSHIENQTTEGKGAIVKKNFVNMERKNSGIVNCGLFVCGIQNLTMLLLLEENAEQNPDLILSLWEICTTNLEKVDILRNKSIDSIPSSGTGSSYSFLSMNPKWGTMQKCGVWGSDDMKVIGSLHQDLIQTQNLTEIIVRNEDAVIYGYRCGSTETFYQQGGSSTLGLPTPADLMGVVPLKARRRLERDHGIILL